MKYRMQDTENNGSRLNGLLSQLAADKKKAVLAFCLIVLMVFMWAKVLGKKTPENAAASVLAQEMTEAQSVSYANEADSELRISFVELPNIKSRNDVLARDFFTVENWRHFLESGKDKNPYDIERVNVVSGDSDEELIGRIAEKLKLEAIVLNENPQAFINDKLLKVGDELSVSDGVRMYECEVTDIEGNTVFIRCGQIEMQLKLTEMSITDYQ